MAQFIAQPVEANFWRADEIYHNMRHYRQPQIKLRGWDNENDDCYGECITVAGDEPVEISDEDFAEVLRHLGRRMYYVEFVLHHGTPFGGEICLFERQGMNILDEALNLYRLLIQKDHRTSNDVNFHVRNLDYILISDVYPVSETAELVVPGAKGKEEATEGQVVSPYEQRVDVDATMKKILLGFYRIHQNIKKMHDY